MLDYFHEDTDLLAGANVYNGQNSVLWCNFRDAFPDEIKATYQDLRSNGVLNYDELIDQFITKGSDKWSESIYNEDADFKYISMLYTDGDASNLGQVRGTGEEHLRYFIENRLNYCDGKWYASDYADDYVALRIYTPSTWAGVEPNADITVTPYSHMYAGVRYKANGTLYQKRVAANEVTKFEAPNETFNDTETAIYGASQLSSLGDLSPLYCGSINVSKAEKLTELIIGSNAEGYSNPNLNDLSVGTNNLLKVLNVRNCSSLTDPLALSGCPNIEEIYAAGSGITGIELANSGYLKTIELPATITNLSLMNQLYIESMTLESYDAIKTIRIENCPTIDGLDILSKATNVERVRLTNVNWTYDTAAGVLALADRNLAGIDENGANIDYMWIDGKCHIKTLTGAEYLEVKEAFPYMTITYDSLTAELIFMSEDGATELTRLTIQNGGDGTDPVTAGTISRPSKTSTAQYHFTYAGWSLTPGGVADENALKNVEADRTVYVAFSKELRSYTVKFYNGTTLLQTSTVQYGGDAVYSGSTPVNNSTGNPADFEFYGWSPAPTNIQGDTSCYAQFHDLREITDSWGTIAAAVADGTATSKYSIGAFKTLDIGAVELPYEFSMGSAVVYNDEIHILGCYNYGTSHYKFDGSTWIEVSTLPYEFYQGSAVVYNDEIHILGCYNYGTSHYKFDGSTWTSVSTLPYKFYQGSAVVYNDEIHILGSYSSSYRTSHYKWDGISWTSVSTLPYKFYTSSAVVYNDEIHILGCYSSSYRTSHYKWDGISWTSVSTLPYDFYDSSAVVYNDEIHILGSYSSSYQTSHYKWNGSTWTSVSTLPYDFCQGSAVVCNNEIHILGSGINSSTCTNHCHYSAEDSKWSKYVTESIPMQIVAHNHDELPDGVGKWEAIAKPTNIPQYGCAVTYQNEVHALGGNSSSSYTKHIKWDTTNSAWVTVSTLPYQFRSGCALVLNDEIHILGSYQTTNKTEHYKWNATDGWVSVSTLPYSFYCSSAVVLNNEIHILGSYDSSSRKYHYKWNGTEWASVSTLPYNFYYGSAVVYNGEIHIFSGSGSSTGHYKWDGSAWTSVSTLPYNLQYGVATIINNEIHIFGGSGSSTGHYKWNGTEWTSMTTLPGNFENYPLAVCNGTPYIFISTSCYKLAGASWESVSEISIANFIRDFGYNGTHSIQNACVIEYKNELHILGTNICQAHVVFDGVSLSLLENDLPTNFNGCGAVVYNDELHVVGGSGDLTAHYKFDGSTWTSVSTTPIAFNGGKLVVYNDEIHVIGGNDTTYKFHYKWDGSTWTEVSTLPHTARWGCGVVVYNGEIHMLGGNGNRTKHYKYNGAEWTLVSTMPYAMLYNGHKRILLYEDEIHMIGSGAATGNVNDHYKWNGTEWVFVEYTTVDINNAGGYICTFRHRLCYLHASPLGDLFVLRNPRATLTFLAGNALKETRVIDSNTGGWYKNGAGYINSEMRTYLNGELFNTLPSDLQSAIKEVNKVVNHVLPNSTLITSTEKCWLLSLDEVGLSDSQALSGQGEVYPTMTSNTSRIRYDSTGTDRILYFLRTSKHSSYITFYRVLNNGAMSNTMATEKQHVIFGFCI